ncbi:MAG: hypothetical protein R2827_15130 [Bdellovibrionales bacterium]
MLEIDLCFCSSNDTVSEVFFNEIEKPGHLIGQTQNRLVYGGANCGLMGRVADAALKSGAPVLGIMPEVFADKGVTHDQLTDLEKFRIFCKKNDAGELGCFYSFSRRYWNFR